MSRSPVRGYLSTDDPSQVPNVALKAGNETAAALFFAAVFGEGSASRSLNFLVVLCAFGTLVTVFIGSSRVIRECGR